MDITGIGSLATAASAIVDKFFPDKTQAEKDQAALAMQQMMNDMKLATVQTDINLEEAKSTSWFVAGWRPYIGWVCGTGLLYQFILMPVLNGVVASSLQLLSKPAIGAVFVSLDVSTLLTCLGGLLGLGGMRTYEKTKGVESNR